VVVLCRSNLHGWLKPDLELLVKQWEPTPQHMAQLRVVDLISKEIFSLEKINEIDMQDDDVLVEEDHVEDKSNLFQQFIKNQSKPTNPNDLDDKSETNDSILLGNQLLEEANSASVVKHSIVPRWEDEESSRPAQSRKRWEDDEESEEIVSTKRKLLNPEVPLAKKKS